MNINENFVIRVYGVIVNESHDENKQLLSIYYLAELANPVTFQISEKPFDFQEYKNGNQSFRWIKINNLNEAEITFPIDKFVAGKLKQLCL